MITNRKRTSLPILIIIAVLTALTLMVSGLLATASANTSATIESAKETLLVDDGSVDDVPSNVGASYSRVAESVAALDDLATYIVVLKDTPLASYRGGVAGLDAPALTDGKLDADSEASSNYLTYLSKRRDAVIESANAALSRDLNVSYEYGATLVGFAAEMTGHEAMQLEKLDGVLFVEKEKMSYPQTDAGPVWSGAADVWGGTWNSLSYKAEISGASEVPSVTTNVSGMGEFTYNFYTNELTYTINISNPDNVNLTAMHIHSATAGANGDVIYNFNIAPTNGDVSATGVVTLTTPGQEAALVNAALYVNIHSDVNTGGEARGQIELNGTLGEGVIVGILDTGVDPWNPSFLAVGGDGYVHTNPLGEGNYLGVCDPSNAGGSGVVAYDPTFPCNSKLIGVWGYTASDPSPRDGDGHGSHTASTAAGNVVFDSVAVAPTQVFTADISGVAPHANIIAYDVCIDGGGCPGASLAAARDQALLDGVDVINYSIGSSAPTGDFWADAESLQWLALRDAGVFVATSNGNSGNGDATTGSPADTPWITSVGANSHNRAFLVTVALSDGVSTVEVSGQAMTSGYGPAPIVFSSDYLGGSEDARLCAPGAFPPGTFSGEIVVCERGIYGRVAKGQAALDGGAGGFILAQPDEATGGPGAVAADTHVLPAAHIDYYQYQILRQFVITDSVAAVSGTLSGASLDVDDSHGDIMAAFSSRGPNGTDADLIVPKVTAPGRAIWAAYHQGPGGDGDYTYNVIQGTSMASPHAAGAGALLSAAHPDWSPAQMESALMLTARDTVLNDDGINIATPFAQGSGHIAVGMAAMSPLVMDVSTAEYEAAEPNDGNDFDVRDLNIASLGEDNCVAVCNWTRTVENVSSGTLTWTTSLTITAPATGTVQPATFTLAPGETQVITVSVDVSGNTPETDWVFGKVELDEDSGTYPDGHLPIAVYPASGNVPETLDIETQFTSGSVDLVDLLSIEITDLYTEATGMVFGDLTTTSLPEDNDNGADFPDIFFDDVSTTFFYSITVPADSFSVIAEIADTTSPDLDMLLFLDDGNGIPELSDVGDPDTNPDACQSASGGSFEFCEILSPTPGTYFAAVINWSASAPPPAEDSLTLSTAVVPNGVDAGNLDVSGPAAVAPAEPFTLTVSYDEPTMTPGDKLYGAVSIGSDPGSPGNVGTIRVYLDYLGIPSIDVTPDAISLTVPAGSSMDSSIIISNAGPGILNWNTTTSAGVNLLADGSLEGGSPNADWAEAGDFGSPICSAGTCGVDLALSGDFYAWYGGWGEPNSASLAQDVVIPSGGVANLSFGLLMGGGFAGPNPTGEFNVTIDGTSVFSATEADEGTYGNGYVIVSVDVGAYADGGVHTLMIEGAETNSDGWSFFVDDISITAGAAIQCNSSTAIPWLNVSPSSGTLKGGEEITATATFDAGGLLAGVYTDALCVANNDPSSEFETVAITLTVTAPEISVDPVSLDAAVDLNGTTTQTLTIENMGNSVLDWSIIESQGAPDVILRDSAPVLAGIDTTGLTDDAPLGLNETFAPELQVTGAVTLWHQPITGTGGIIADYVAPDSAGAFSAADFSVDDVVSIDYFFTPGFVSGSSTSPLADALGITWAIYADDGGSPAGHPEESAPVPNLSNAVWSYTAAPGSAGVGLANDDITLDLEAAGRPKAVLTPGNYWLVVYVTTEDLGVIRWNWSQGVQIGAEAQLVSPQIFGVNDWTAFSSLGLTFTDVSFTLGGDVLCSGGSAIDWVSVNPTSGTTASNGSSSVDVVFDATGLAGGTHTGELCVISNDPVNPVVSVPVSLTVEAANLRVAHLAPFAMDPGTAVTVTLDGNDILTSFEFGDSTSYIPVPVGEHTVQVYAGGTPVISETVDLMSGMDYSAIAAGGANGWDVELVVSVDDNTAPTAGFGHVRLGHLAPFTSVLTDTLADVRTDDGTVVADDVPYGAISGYLSLPAGEYDLSVTSADGSVVLINIAPFTLNSGDILYALAVGDGTNQDLGVFAWATDTTGALLPLEVYRLNLPIIVKP